MDPLSQMTKDVKEFCEARNWDQFHGPKDLAIGLVTEASELLEIFRFQSEEESLQEVTNSQERERVGDELADVMFFLIRFAQMNKFDLAQVLSAKMQKNALKYPVETAKNSNKKYNKL